VAAGRISQEFLVRRRRRRLIIRTESCVARSGPPAPTRARRLFDASVDQTDARNDILGCFVDQTDARKSMADDPVINRRG
jgi:hypothetical protein